MGFDPSDDVYNKLTDSPSTITPSNQKWTLFLILCCLTVTTASFQFGYNISSLNSPTEVLKDFISNKTFLFKVYFEKKELFYRSEGWLIGNETEFKKKREEYDLKKQEYIASFFSLDMDYRRELEANKIKKEKEVREKYNMTIDEFFKYAENKLREKRAELEKNRPLLADGLKKVLQITDYIWTTINCLFVIGGMIGAFTSKIVLDLFGRKKGILFHNIFSIVGCLLVVISYCLSSPVCLVISRFLFGVQGGMSCSLIPTYLSEISPLALRGQTGVIHQLCLTIGILVAQILGFRQILGSGEYWHYLLAFPILPAILGSISLLIFFPETPKALIQKNNDREAAQKALQQLRNRVNVNGDLQEIFEEVNKSGQNTQNFKITELFTQKELRWSLITSLILQLAQQLCGINAIFFYSNSIFKDAGISADLIQYAVFSTGLINVISTVICVPLIDRLGRKPLLVFPMILIVFDFILLTIFLILSSKTEIVVPLINATLKGQTFSYLSIVCIMVFIVCFAVGLGPIPFIYVTECFRQNAVGSALALCMLTNWTANLVLTLTFPYLAKLLTNYVFIVFTIIVVLSVSIIIAKVPETKGKNVEETIAKLNGRDIKYQKSDALTGDVNA